MVIIETVWFELDKHYAETRMQLTLSDADMFFDNSSVKFSGLQYRGFARVTMIFFVKKSSDNSYLSKQ